MSTAVDFELGVGHVIKNENFRNLRWRTAAIFKIVMSPYFSEKSSDFDETLEFDRTYLLLLRITLAGQIQGKKAYGRPRAMLLDWLLKTKEGNISYQELTMSVQDRSRWSQWRCKPAIWQNTAERLEIITFDKGGGRPTCFCSCLSVCLSVSKVTQKRVHGFGWFNVACRQMSGHGRTD